MLINPSIPLRIFLPPAVTSADPTIPPPNFIGNKDHNGLNTGTFFLRVHPWSVHFLAQTLAFSAYQPSIDTGNSVDQFAMAHILNTTSPPPDLVTESEYIGWDGGGGTEEQRGAMRVGGSNGEVLYQPRIWYNTYEWRHAYEGKEGNLLVHFPGLEEERWDHMQRWLTELEQRQDRWDVALDKTFYSKDVGDYWTVVTRAHAAFDEGMKWFFNNPYAGDGGAKGEKAKEERQRVAQGRMDELAYCLRFATDDVGALGKAVDGVVSLMESEKSRDGRGRGKGDAA